MLFFAYRHKSVIMSVAGGDDEELHLSEEAKCALQEFYLEQLLSADDNYCHGSNNECLLPQEDWVSYSTCVRILPCWYRLSV